MVWWSQTWTSAEWKYAIWWDESSFILFPASGWTHDEAYNSECLVQTVKHGGSSMMIWAAISWYSAGPIIKCEWSNYCQDNVDSVCDQVNTMVQMLLTNNDAVFQDDSSPVHTARSVQYWFEQHEDALQHLPWPAQSPDLNIIKPLWSVV
jgi:hypothetical protein